MKSSLMVSWVKRGFSSSAARLAVLLLILLAAAQPAQAATVSLIVSKEVTGTGAGTVSSTPGNISCGATCYDTFVLDENNPAIVTLSAQPAAGSIFAGWQYYSGGIPVKHACNSGYDVADVNAGTCLVTMTENRTFLAKFTLNASAVGLTATTSGTGSGTVTTDPGPMYCSPSCYESFAANTKVTLTATPAPGSKVAGWSINGVAGSNLTVNAVAVNAAAKTVTLTLSSAVPAGQSVSLAYTDPGTINAIQDASGNNAVSQATVSVLNLAGAGDTTAPVFGMATVNGNQLVMSYLDANNLDSVNIPAVGAFAVLRNGGNNVVTNVAVSAANKTVTLTLTTAAIASDAVSVAYTDPTAGNDTNAIQDASGNDAASLSTTNVTNITGSPADAVLPVFGMATVNGNQLVMSYLDANNLDSVNIPLASAFGVQLGCTGSGNTCVTTADSAKTVNVVFDTDPNAKNLSVIKTGTGTGIVRSNPLGIYCGAFCNETYTLDTLVTLSATPDSGSTFSGWTLPDGAGGTTPGSCIGSALTDLSCVVKMDASKSVKANFDVATSPTGNTLYLYKLGSGSGAVTSDPAGISCLAAGCTDANAKFTSGTPVTLTATHSQGSTFAGWSGGGSAVAVTNVAINKTAKTVTLTLASPVASGQSVTIAYTDPSSGNDGNAIQDTYGTDAISHPASSVTNLTGPVGDTTPPNFVQATVIGKTLVMSYADAAHSLGGTAPAASAFTVLADNVAVAVSAAAITAAAKTVTLTLASDITAGQSVTVAYAVPTTNPIQDSVANIAASLAATVATNLTGVAVGTLPPTFALASVDTSTLVMSYTGPFDLNEDNPPPFGAFAVEVGGSNSCIGTGTSCIVTMSKAQTVTASFDGVPPSFFTLHIGKLGSGSGLIKSTGISQDPITCGSDCDGSFTLGTPVVLKAEPGSDSNFSGWTGCTNSPSASEDCYVLKTQSDISLGGTSYGVTATFVKKLSPNNFTLTVLRAGSGTGTITSAPVGSVTSTAAAGASPINSCTASVCSSDFVSGTLVALTATAATGNTFLGWGGECSGSDTCVVTMDKARSVTATFKIVTAVGFNTLNVLKAGSGTGIVKSDPTGIDCGTTCYKDYANGTLVALTATPTPGHTFFGWGGDCSGSGTCVVSMSAAKNVSATFNSTTSDITVSKAGNGSGTVTSSPAGISTSINCGSTCSASYASGVIVTLTAAPASGSAFTGWSGDCSGSTSTCVVTVSTAKNVTATFANSVTITTTASPTAGGTVTCTPNPVSVGSSSTCTAVANAGYTFSAWSGNCTGASCSLSNVTAVKSVTATFTSNTHSVTANAAPTGGGTVSCTPANPVTTGSRVNCIVSKTNPGYSFTAWSGDCLGATCSMGNITTDKTVTANFTQTTFGISVTASPAAGGSVSCDKNPVGYGETSTCTATANLGYNFNAWGSCPTATGNKCTLSNVKANMSVSATFTAIVDALSTTTLVASPNSPTSIGKSTTLTVTVSGTTAAGTPTGRVLFKDAGVTLGTMLLSGTGEASYSANFSAGLHSLSASYAGNSTYQASTSNVISYQVDSIATTLSVSTRSTLSQPGFSVPVTVIVTPSSNPGNISGTVQVSSDDGPSCSIALPITSCTLTFASKGKKKLTASYSGNSFYSASSATSTHFVGMQPSLTPMMLLLLD